MIDHSPPASHTVYVFYTTIEDAMPHRFTLKGCQGYFNVLNELSTDDPVKLTIEPLRDGANVHIERSPDPNPATSS